MYESRKIWPIFKKKVPTKLFNKIGSPNLISFKPKIICGSLKKSFGDQI